MLDSDVHGPIDFVILEFPGGAVGAETGEALVELVDRAIVRLYDLMLVCKDARGACAELDLVADGPLGGLAQFAGARSGLLAGNDVLDVADALEPNTVALVLLYENAWAVPFVAAARGEGGQMVASSRLSAQEIMDALDKAESPD